MENSTILTLRFHFKTVDESIEFIDESKSMFAGFEYTTNIDKSGKIVIFEILKIKDKVVWEVKGRSIYMN